METDNTIPDPSRLRHRKSTARSTARRALDIPRQMATKAATNCSVVQIELRLKKMTHNPPTKRLITPITPLILRIYSKEKPTQKLRINPTNHPPWFCLISPKKNTGETGDGK